MSTTCEVPFEPLSLDGSNYSSWSAHVLNVLRTMGPSFEQIVDESILPNDFDNLFKLSNEEMKCLINNRRVINLLFKNMDRELSDLIHKDDKLKRYDLMPIIFGSSLSQYVKKMMTMKIKKKKSH